MLGRATLFTLAATIAVAVPALANAQNEGRARAYAQEHNVPVRIVKTGAPNRPVRRAFVPILSPAHLASFQRTYGSEHGGVTLNFDGGTHLMLSLQPGDVYFWARNRIDLRQHYDVHRPTGGRTLALRLDGALAHLQGWLAQRIQPGDQLYCDNVGNCMEWLPNAEVGPGLPLFHHLGLRRSHDGPNMRAKLMHAANDLVDVIGVHVENVGQFEAMSEAQLLLAPPAGGLDDAAR